MVLMLAVPISNVPLAACISSPSFCNDDVVKNGVALHLPQVKTDESKVIVFIPRLLAQLAKHFQHEKVRNGKHT